MAERQTLVLLCGIGEDEQVWAPVAAALADIADCRPMVAEGESIAAMAADVVARTRGPIAVVGHSLGGYVAMAVQRAAPERVTRLALLNTSALPEDATALTGRGKLIDRIARDGFAEVVRLIAPALGNASIDTMAMLLRTGPNRFVRDQRAAMTRPDARAGLAAIAVPLLVIGGAQDAVIPAARSAEIAAIVPGAALVILPDAGHVSPLEAPVPVADALCDWLAA